jgi:hypothetical protein
MKLRFNNLNTTSSASSLNLLVGFLTTCILYSMCLGWSVQAKAKLDVKMNPQTDIITFDFSAADTSLKQNQVKINVNSKTKGRPLLSIEIAGVQASKKWFIEFNKSQYPDIKGILLKRTDQGGQLRIRYLKSVPSDFSKQIKLKQIDGRLQITVPSKVQVIPSAIDQIKPTQSAQVKRVREITSGLKEDSANQNNRNVNKKPIPSAQNDIRRSTNKTASPSPLEKNTNTTPLPPTDQMRRVNQKTTVTPNSMSPQVASGSSTRKQPSFEPKTTAKTIPNT